MYLDTDTRYSRVSIKRFTRYFTQIIYTYIHTYRKDRLIILHTLTIYFVIYALI